MSAHPTLPKPKLAQDQMPLAVVPEVTPATPPAPPGVLGALAIMLLQTTIPAPTLTLALTTRFAPTALVVVDQPIPAPRQNAKIPAFAMVAEDAR